MSTPPHPNQADSAATDSAETTGSSKSFPEKMGGISQVLGIEMVEMTPDRVVATMPVTPDHHQPFGYLHGGASVVLAESVASIGGYLAAPEGYTAMGLEINANHVRAMREGTLTATAEPVHKGRTTQVWTIDLRNEQGKLVCTSRCTLAIIKERASG